MLGVRWCECERGVIEFVLDRLMFANSVSRLRWFLLIVSLSWVFAVLGVRWCESERGVIVFVFDGLMFAISVWRLVSLLRLCCVWCAMVWALKSGDGVSFRYIDVRCECLTIDYSSISSVFLCLIDCVSLLSVCLLCNDVGIWRVVIEFAFDGSTLASIEKT